MRWLLIALALLLTTGVAAGEAQASQYKGYWYGAKHPREIADLVERSLRADPAGRTMLSLEKCRKDGSCAAPINYLESFQAHDPHGGWTLENMAQKMRTLEIECKVSGEYQMDRIIYTSGSLGKTDVSGMSRRFKKDECAWVNPVTRRPVLAEDCANPVGQRIDLVCVYVNFENRVPAEKAVIWARYRKKEDPCFAYRRVAKAEQLDTRTAIWHTVPEGCIGFPCDLTAVNRIVGSEPLAQGQLPLTEVGHYQIRMSPEEFLVLCLKSWDLGTVRSSFSSGVRWRQDYRQVSGQWHARVFYIATEMPRGVKVNEPRGLFFWAPNEAYERELYRQFGQSQ